MELKNRITSGIKVDEKGIIDVMYGNIQKEKNTFVKPSEVLHKSYINMVSNEEISGVNYSKLRKYRPIKRGL